MGRGMGWREEGERERSKAKRKRWRKRQRKREMAEGGEERKMAESEREKIAMYITTTRTSETKSEQLHVPSLVTTHIYTKIIPTQPTPYIQNQPNTIPILQGPETSQTFPRQIMDVTDILG